MNPLPCQAQHPPIGSQSIDGVKSSHGKHAHAHTLCSGQSLLMDQVPVFLPMEPRLAPVRAPPLRGHNVIVYELSESPILCQITRL